MEMVSKILSAEDDEKDKDLEIRIDVICDMMNNQPYKEIFITFIYVS